ncbi:MAG: DNA-processing protein DprA [Planctomycetes bacterium]|nr:DNA-processing protein DprA [Planctomycetota bacterium]
MVEDLASWVALHGIPGMGAATFLKLIDRFGTPRDALEQATAGDLARMPRIPAGLAEGIAQARERIGDAERRIESLLSEEIHIITIEDADYPKLLRRIRTSPPLLYCRGRFEKSDETALAIIGATHPSPKGRETAYEFGRRFAEAGHTVVSGYAHGIDTAGHLGAVEAGGRSVFVLAEGIRQFHPRKRFPDTHALAANGAIISECLPDQEWTSVGALARNRITAGLSRAVLVVEAREQSGTMATFNIAQREGIPCFVLDYRNPPPTAAGNVLAIERGGIPIRSYAEIDKVIEVLKSDEW